MPQEATVLGQSLFYRDRAFPARIDRRLSLFFLVLFVLVVVVGGTSLYFTRVIFFSVEELRKESDRLDLVNRMHYTVHHLVEETQAAALHVTALSESRRAAYFRALRDQLRRYREEGGTAAVVAEFTHAIDELDVNSEEVVKHVTASPAEQPHMRELLALTESSGRIQGLAHGLTASHMATMDSLVSGSSWKMKTVLWLYGGFVAAGTVLILVASVFFFRSVAQPLRRMAEAAGAIADGKEGQKLTVASKDEIGQLSHAFNIMTDRLKEKEQELHGLATLQERERIAQELHDTLAQELALLQIKLNEAEANVPPDGAASMRRTLKDMRKIVERAYEEVRQAIFGLHIMVSQSLGLIPTLAEYLHDYSEMTKIPVALKVSRPEATRFAPHVEVQLIRIVHEALTNMFKHAAAHKAAVSFEVNDGYGEIVVEDDGRGFLVQPPANNALHFGLRTMQERAEGVGGKLKIDSAPGKGTRVVVYLPLEKEAA
jgi:signal transduction histidine kinase